MSASSLAEAAVAGRDAERAYSPEEAAAVKGVSVTYIRDAIKSTGVHHLRAKRVGRYLRIRASDLDEWFDGLPDA